MFLTLIKNRINSIGIVLIEKNMRNFNFITVKLKKNAEWEATMQAAY